MKGLSIRWRIALWNTAAFAVVLLSFGLLIYGLLRKTHYDQVDRILHARFAEISAEMRRSEAPVSRFQHWTRGFGKHTEVMGAVFDSQNEVVAQATELPPLSALARSTPSSQVRIDTLVLPEVGRVRRLTGALDAGKPFTVMLFAELEHVDEEMSLVAKSLLVTVPLTLVVAGALAYLLAWRSLAPVEQLRKLTDEITAERLDRRLPIANPADELGLLAQTVNFMISRLARSFEEIRRFTADASHEMRTPIAIIRSEAELGIDAAKSLEDARDRFESILEESVRLTALTDQLLTLCREDTGVNGATYAPVRLAELLADSAETFQALSSMKRQHLMVEADDAAVVSGDAERLRQVVFNLVENAIKYTPEGGSIRLALHRCNGEAVLEVQDTGVGISPEHQSHVFERFYRVDRGRSQREGGAGLGLSIVRSIVSAHGGRVEVESAVEQGSVFRVSLPLKSHSPSECGKH